VTLRGSFDFLAFPATREAIREYFRRWKPVLSNLISSDVYLMASAISTCAVLSFFPFTILLLTILKNVFHFQAGADLIVKVIEAYLPYLDTFPAKISAEIGTRHLGQLQLVSALILIVSAIGVFIPIEVTLNRIWQASGNMSFLKNQMISFGVILLCTILSLLSFIVGGVGLHAIRWLPSPVEEFTEHVFVKVLGFVLSIALFFVVFCLLPNIRVKLDTTLRASIFTGVVWELAKYAYLWSLGKLDLSGIYGPYFTSAVVLVLWSYVSAMIMILGAELAHRELLSLRIFQPAYAEWKLLHAESRRLA